MKDAEVHRLPRRSEGDWHPMVRRWWASVWRSPMASEFVGPDVLGGLFLLADLYQARWTTADPAVLCKVASEIRLQEVRFGLSPIDRRRLQWEIEKGEQAEERTTRRKAVTKKQNGGSDDPRDLLRVVS